MPTLNLAEMEGWTVQVLMRSGLGESDARWVAASLTFAESRGVASHGLMRLPTYVNRIVSGGINRNPAIRIDQDLGALAIVDADHAAGAASGVYAVDLAVTRARRWGIGCAIAHSANHYGASAFFTDRIAQAGLLGVAICNTESVMSAPYGGRPVLGTNPLAVAVPLPSDRRPHLDMATTTASQGKLLMAEQAGERIPVGWAVDKLGRATRSAKDGLAGALLPSGGPKGFGLAFAIDAILAISGANVSPDVAALNGEPSQPQQLGHAFIALRVDVVGSLDAYRKRIYRLLEAIHSSGVDRPSALPMAPGEPEMARARELDGRIEIGSDLVRELAQLAATTGMDLPGSVAVSA